MTQPALRVAVAGYGYIAHYHARAALELADTELVAVMGHDAIKARAFADKYALPKAYATGAELAADPDIDLVVIALPNALHAPLANQLMEAGKHVLVEKPMALDAVQARGMAAVAARTGRRLLVGHQWRFDREALWLRDRVAAGDLGEIVKVKSYGIHANWGPTGWFVDPALAGGGALVDMGVHALDTLRFLLGDPQPLSVYARIDTRFGDYEVDDVGVVIVNWEGGITSVVESGWWNPHLDGVEASTQLFGTRGYGRLFPTSVSPVVNWRPQPNVPSFPARTEHCDQHTYTGQLAELAAAVREGREPSPGPADGLVIMRICDAAYASAREDQVIRL